MSATPYMPVADGERAALQALLRGAKECAAGLPEWSPRRRSVEGLASDLAGVLADDHEEA
jgi:hypothetical protein